MPFRDEGNPGWKRKPQGTRNGSGPISLEPAKRLSSKEVGCEFCPLNRDGINKIISPILGKEIMLWPQSPGLDENNHKNPDGTKGKELVGRAGRWLWQELKRVGIQRDDCDISNVVRCVPAEENEYGYLTMRDPTKEELHCCTKFTKEALVQQKARVWLVFGKYAREQLFAKKTKMPGDVFYHQESIRVFILDHPAYFIRGQFPPERLVRFRLMLDMVRETLDTPKHLTFQVFQDILPNVKVATSGKRAAEFTRELIELSRTENERLSIDEEDDVIEGEKKLLVASVCVKPKVIRVYVFDHPENKVSNEEKQLVKEEFKALLRSDRPKVLHSGNHDDGTFKTTLAVDMDNYHYDTRYASYFSEPYVLNHSYTLGAITARHFPRYTGYKNYVKEAAPKDMSVEDAKDVGEFHLANAPLSKVAIYCAADSFVTKLEEMRVRDKVPAPLVRIYTEAAFILNDMENNGPLLDYDFCNRLSVVYPARQEFYRGELRKLSNNPDLNPNSPLQLKKLLFEQWGLEPILEKGKVTTSAEVLDLLLNTNYPNHKGLKALQAYRTAKTENERLEAFKRSANAHNGHVTTIWWLTGARTGRMSSGGGTRPDKRNLGNLQNIPRRALIENGLVSAVNWRDWYDLARRDLRLACKRYRNMKWFIVVDYSQMELRVLAVTVDEREMIDMFNSGKDIHSAIGSLWSGWTVEELMEEGERRTIVKTFHFGVIYGLSPVGLQSDLQAAGIKVSVSYCENIFKKYFGRFRRIKDYKEEQPKFVEKHGYAENIFGFRVPIDVTGQTKGGFWRNQAVNSPIQGAAHQILVVCLALKKRFPEKYSAIVPQMEIHDALVNVDDLERIPETVSCIKQLMEKDALDVVRNELGVKRWNVPLVADAKIGLRYGALAKFKGNFLETFTAKGKGVIDVIEEQDKKLFELEQTYGTQPVEYQGVE